MEITTVLNATELSRTTQKTTVPSFLFLDCACHFIRMKVRERGNRKENCKIAKMLLDVVTFSWKIISNKFEQRSVANVDKVI